MFLHFHFLRVGQLGEFGGVRLGLKLNFGLQGQHFGRGDLGGLFKSVLGVLVLGVERGEMLLQTKGIGLGSGVRFLCGV